MEKTAEEQSEITPDVYLLKGMFPETKTMNKKRLLEEVNMWRNIWQWIPPEVKYYVSRTGQLVAITMRNYKRYMGKLLATYWKIEEVELGVEDVIYDLATRQNFYEHKIIRTGMGGIIDFQIIHGRISEEELRQQAEQEEEQRIEDAEQTETTET